MQSDVHPQYEDKNQSLGSVLRDIGISAKDLIQSELELIKIELKTSAKRFGKQSAQLAGFTVLLALSVVPFMAFLIIGLGELLDGRYWQSSLIVAVVFAVIGGFSAYRAFQKIKNDDFDLHHARDGFGREMDALRDKLQEIKLATQRRTL